MATKKKVVKKTASKKTEVELLRNEIRELKRDVQDLASMVHYAREQRLDIHEMMRRLERQTRRDINHVHERLNKIDPEEMRIKAAQPINDALSDAVKTL